MSKISRQSCGLKRLPDIPFELSYASCGSYFMPLVDDGVYQNIALLCFSSTDTIQMFVEDKVIRTRPFDFGTDAIERMRVAPAQSMLDADFEYGLQPTKWQAIVFAMYECVRAGF